MKTIIALSAKHRALAEKQEMAVEKLLAKYQVPFNATAADCNFDETPKPDSNPDSVFFARFKLGDVVKVDLQGGMFAKILALTFMPGKVLYNLACYTGKIEKDLTNQFGEVNSVGWDDQGLEYIRMYNVDSIYIVAHAGRVNCRCYSMLESQCSSVECPRKTAKFIEIKP